MIYKWKDGAHISADATIAGEICEELASRNELTAKKLVEVSASEDAPLHRCFEWDNDIAAQKFREHQANHIINCIVTIAETKEPTRAFFTLKSTGNEYRSLNVLINNTDTRQELLEQAYKELEAFKRKYKTLSALATLIKTIDTCLEQKGA